MKTLTLAQIASDLHRGVYDANRKMLFEDLKIVHGFSLHDPVAALIDRHADEDCPDVAVYCNRFLDYYKFYVSLKNL